MPWESFLEPVEGFNDTWKTFIWGTHIGFKSYREIPKKCSKCNERFKKGDRAYRRKTHNSIAVYCEQCFNKMFFEPIRHPAPSGRAGIRDVWERMR